MTICSLITYTSPQVRPVNTNTGSVYLLHEDPTCQTGAVDVSDQAPDPQHGGEGL